MDKVARVSQSVADADAYLFIVSGVAGLILLTLPMAALGGFWLYYFNRAAIKRLFANTRLNVTPF